MPEEYADPVDQNDVVALARTIEPNLGQQIEFLVEIDKLKGVLRQSLLVDGSRYENTAEHSWHLALVAMILAPHAAADVDVTRAVEILIIHDLVEIDAGDTYIYDEEGRADKEEREQAAAERIFTLLPPHQAERIRALWDEYEERTTSTARFAYAVDRLQPLLLNASAGGISWQHHGIRHSQTVDKNGPIAEASETLWRLASSILDTAADQGLLTDDRA